MIMDPMAEIRASFFVECDELMESLQDALAVLDGGGRDGETINVIFRAVHSIKGGAGAFGLDALVDCAHRLETVLDELRIGRLDVTRDAIKLLFQGADLLHDHVRAAQADRHPPDGTERVLSALEALMPKRGPEMDQTIDFIPATLDLDFGSFDGAMDTPCGGVIARRIHFRPHAELYSSGNEALLVLRALAALGEVQTACAIPGALRLCPETVETPLLAWTVDLTGTATDDQVYEIFDFVTGVCDLEIVRIAQPDPETFAAGAADGDVRVPSGCGNAIDPEAASAVVAEPGFGDATAAPAAGADQTVERPNTAPALARQDAAPEAAPVTVRVDLDRVDRLVNLVGELVINQAMLTQSVTEAGMAECNSVRNGLDEFMTLTRDIQDSVMLIRAQPVKPLFQRMARVIREAASATGKDVRLRTEGDMTEIDKTVIERLSDPLTHMIRNAVDHGLETPDRRVAAGKPAEGSITLTAAHRAGRVVVEISDDGAGIDRRKVRATAIAHGLIPPDAQLSEGEIDTLLFLPGFSTSPEVSALSGRGVGMDVVKRAITALGGRIALTSDAGVGTRFSISLPLTLAVMDGMVVSVAGQTVVLPLSEIIETAALSPDNMRRIGRSTDLLRIRGKIVPLFDLGVQLGFRDAVRDAEGAIVILTAREDGSRAALIVDGILEQRQVVIKGMGRDCARIPGVAAATILGNGHVALILDPSELMRPHRVPPASAQDLVLAG